MRRMLLILTLIGGLFVFNSLLAETINCYPQEADFWTGYVVTDNFGKHVDNLNMWSSSSRYGFAKFDLSSVPDNIIVTSINLHAFLHRVVNQSATITISEVSCDPVTAWGEVIIPDIINGPEYYSGNTWAVQNTWITHTLNSIAVDSLQSILDSEQDWFAIGAYSTSSTAFREWDGNSNMNLCVYLEIEYIFSFAGNVSGIWQNNGYPYHVHGNITITTGSELEIEPGVEVIFTGHHKFNVNGRLLAQGTENDMITFTAQDTANGWHGLRFSNTNTNGQDSSKVEYCKFEYGNASYGTPLVGRDDEGGAILFYKSSDVVVKNSIFENNKGYYGGAISCYEISDVTIENCHFAHNSTNYGGALRAVFSSYPTIQNVTVANNTGAGISAHGGGSIAMNNSICWDNSGDEILLDGGSASVTYSDIQGGWTGTGNIDDDPLFVDPLNSDYHLTATSPCIDAGDPTSPLDPDGTIADMGTYYYPHVSCTNLISPTENSEWITKYPTLKWEEHFVATGYKLSLGTDDPPTNILDEVDLGNVTSYKISSAFEPSTPYFWKVIPYDAQYTATNCPVWSFTTQTDVINAGNAFDFGNTRQNDYLEISYSESMNPDQFTVSLWAKIEGGQNTYRSAITSRGNSTDGYLIYASNDNQWEFWTGTGSSWSVINGPDIDLDTWTHIAATFDGSTMKLFINGNDTGITATNNSYMKNPQYPCRIGAGETEHTTPNYYFDGVIDEVRLWNYARTETEIQADMNIPLEGNESGLNSYWRFDSDNTTYSWDCIGENQAQLINNPTRVTSSAPISAFLEIPQNVTIEIIGADVQISWNAVAGANSYKIYAADDPYGTFSDVSGSGTFADTSWTATIPGDKKFYYVVASTDVVREDVTIRQLPDGNERKSLSEVSRKETHNNKIRKVRRQN